MINRIIKKLQSINYRYRTERKKYRIEKSIDDRLLMIYDDYESYLSHQAEKLNKNRKTVEVSDQEYRKIILSRYRNFKYIDCESIGLCMGARLGGEVKAFNEISRVTVGIDINPGDKNEFVLYGDVHKTVFNEASFDFIFTNIIDHILLPEKFYCEIHRLLKIGGIFITELASARPREGSYEVLDTTNIKKVIADIEKNLKLQSKSEVVNKTNYINWTGTQLIFKKND